MIPMKPINMKLCKINMFFVFGCFFPIQGDVSKIDMAVLQRQGDFQDPYIWVCTLIPSFRPYFGGISPSIALKHRPYCQAPPHLRRNRPSLVIHWPLRLWLVARKGLPGVPSGHQTWLAGRYTILFGDFPIETPMKLVDVQLPRLITRG